MGKLEKEILKDIKQALSNWESRGVVISWDRHNSGMSMVNGRYVRLAQEGTPDIIAYIKNIEEGSSGAICWVYFIEAKKEGGGDWRKSQRKFCDKLKGLTNVIYELVDDAKQVNHTIEEITKHEQKKLDSIKFME